MLIQTRSPIKCMGEEICHTKRNASAEEPEASIMRSLANEYVGRCSLRHVSSSQDGGGDGGEDDEIEEEHEQGLSAADVRAAEGAGAVVSGVRGGGAEGGDQ